MKFLRHLFLVFFLLGLINFAEIATFSLQAQNKNTRSYLQRERNAILSRINKTNRILARARQDRNSALQNLHAISGQIKQREALLGVLEQEAELIEAQISQSEQVVQALEDDLTALKAEYAKVLLITFKMNNQYDRLVLLLASENLQELLARLRYFQKYNEVRNEQIIQIEKLKNQLLSQNAKLASQREEKTELYAVQAKEKIELEQLKKKQSGLISQIRNKESQLLSELGKEKRVLKELNELVSQSIGQAEFAASLSGEEKLLATNFAKNKGNMIWPVQNGFISAHFGIQEYLPTKENEKKIEIEKLGIDIRTSPAERVRAIFVGKVVDVSEIPGRGYLVIIQHGEYFTVYSKLKTVSIKAGDKVQTKQEIGTVGAFKNDLYEIEFQIWRHQTKLNPEHWITK
ncbi:murein hydrolase activator EnvC family protein [Hugenholtzia roseola]|uniref:murein hydrolase activator EnvC family protein n=1 Tax=Hugenholtzia roseola TaxID=1002 RepID=UPI00047A21A2|nr:peptidoglycan DD-metalloendopeptidase family protein [Hugenholtzia roseola]